MPRVVVIDACVLYSATLRDVLLRFAEIGLLMPCWSERILAETAQALRRTRPDIRAEQIEHLMRCMKRAFPEAMVEPAAVVALGLPDPDDEHILAVATACSADLVVTLNLRDFPARIVRRSTSARVISPDQLFMALLQEDERAVRFVIDAMAADLRNPPITPEQLIAGMRKQVPRFAEAYGRSRP